MKRLAALFIFAMVSLGACGGTPTTSVSPAQVHPSPTATVTANPAASPSTDPVAALETAVRRYSAAFLSGKAKEAWLMRTERSNAGLSYAEFRAGVLAAKQIYGDAVMTSLDVEKMDGASAWVTYRYDVSDIDQVGQPWRLVGGEWCYDQVSDSE
jgi:hypothetical protein